MKHFPTWKTICIGGVAREELVTWIPPRADYCTLPPLAEVLLGYDTFQTEMKERHVRLGRASFLDLELSRPTLFSQILVRIRELGHELCPAEVGPHLRRVYKEQEPWDKCIYLAMEPFNGANRNSVEPHNLIFRLDHDNMDKQQLELTWVGSPDVKMSGGEFVFVLGE